MNKEFIWLNMNFDIIIIYLKGDIVMIIGKSVGKVVVIVIIVEGKFCDLCVIYV